MLSNSDPLEQRTGIGEKTQMHPLQTDLSELVSTNPEAISRLLSAAIVDQTFGKLLLTRPGHAMAIGYNGETFDLTDDDRALIESIQANSLPDFAAQLVQLRGKASSNEGIFGKHKTEKDYFTVPFNSKQGWEGARLRTI